MKPLLMVVSALRLLPGAVGAGTYSVKPIKIELSERVPHMLDLVKRTTLPATELQPARDSLNSSISTGIPLSTMKSLQEEWITKFNWEEEQASINQYELVCQHRKQD
jgi:hypothetical protein